MDITSLTKHERTHRVVLTEAEIHDLLVAAVAEKVGIYPNEPIASKVFISNRNSGSINPTHYQAEVVITQDLSTMPTAEA